MSKRAPRKNIMKIAVYSPYISKHTGGGEKYLFDCATTMAKLGHQVTVVMSELSDIATVRQKYERFLGYSLASIHFMTTPLGTPASFLSKLFWTRRYDAIYYATDGSFFFSLAARNIAHIQIPFTTPQRGVMNRLKLLNWRIKNANSQFTQSIVSKVWQTPIEFVHYPLIEAPAIAADLHKKEKIILNVGRFFRQLHSKRQDVLVDIFRHLQQVAPATLKGWKLVLIGAVEDQEYFDQVKQAAKGFPIEFYTNLNRESLLDWYRRATVYWHSTGFEVNAEREPAKVEHFGISTVEAMSYGCLPVVLAQGGQREVLGETLAELGWQTKPECVEITRQLLENATRRQQLAEQAVAQAATFGPDRFTTTLERMLNS